MALPEQKTLYEQQCEQTELRSADLKDLQDKYETLLTERREQDFTLSTLAAYIDQALALASPPPTIPKKTVKTSAAEKPPISKRKAPKSGTKS